MYISSIFRFMADLLHLYSKKILIAKILETNSVSGISLKTQLLYLLVFIFRYLDIPAVNFTPFKIYIFTMKIFFIAFQLFILFQMKFNVRLKYTYESIYDTFYLRTVLIPLLFLGSIFRSRGNFFIESLYTASIFLEAVAILPQLVMIQNSQSCESLTLHYILCIGAYRLCYVLCWIMRIIENNMKIDIKLICGALQTFLYGEFFMRYYRFVYKGDRPIGK